MCLQRGNPIRNVGWVSLLFVIAGNISPIDVRAHVQSYVKRLTDLPSKEDLAAAGATKRPTCCVLVLTKPTKGALGPEEQEKIIADVSELTSSLFQLT